MNTESFDCRNVGKFDGMEKPGDFYFADRDGHEGIMIILPDEGWHHIPIQKGPAPDGKVWGWDGNTDKPTLTPSIRSSNWHGYLTNGRLVSC